MRNLPSAPAAPLCLATAPLPANVPYVLTEVPGGPVLITVRAGIGAAQLAAAFRRTLTGPVRPWAFAALGMPDPDTAPQSYEEARRRLCGRVVDAAAAEQREQDGRPCPRPHGAG
ncbi:hypothetical protein J0910_03640 [Nocardiopsis sp. CNT-189]|uniref:hypothetical protein n=1 Tax=Nocardiopsis oceanisediminis TaxID=2816862 RepID=UPI003B2D79B8